MDLPTYTNIWRIEKRLYKLYDFRLPMPLPINWIAVFAGITIPYIILLIAIGLPFNHTLVWLYVLPPGLITWLTTRPVIENKRLPELLESQVRYLAEPRTWVRFAPLTEKEQMVVTARVWHRSQPVAEQAAEAGQLAAASGTAGSQAAAGQESDGAQAPRTPSRSRRPVPASQRNAAPGTRARSRLSAMGRSGTASAAAETPARQAGSAARPKRSRRAVQATSAAAPAAMPDVVSPQPVQPPLPAVRRPSAEPRRSEGMPVRARGGALAPARLEVSHDGPGRAPVVVVPPAKPVRPAPPANPVNAWPAPARPLRRLSQEMLPPEPVELSAPVLPAAPFQPAAPTLPFEPTPEIAADVAAVPATDQREPAADPDPDPEPEPEPEAAAPPEPEAAAEPETEPEVAANLEPEAAAEREAAFETEPEVAANLEPEAELEAEYQPEPEPAHQPEPAVVRAAAYQPELAHEPELPYQPAPAYQPQPAQPRPAAELPQPAEPPPAAQPAGLTATVEETVRRAVPSIERALSGPSKDRNLSWHGTVKIVTGTGAAQGPGARDQEALDRNRARLPIQGPRRILVLGCTTGAGQTVTAMMTGYMLASLREEPVAAVDLHDGTLARYRAPAAWLDEILAGRPPQAVRPALPDGLNPTPKTNPARLDIIASHEPLGDGDELKLAVQLNRHYPLTVLDGGPTVLTKLLKVTDQLVLVAPANVEAAGALADTRDWLDAHGHAELAMQSVTVINGVSRRSLPDVEQAESIARGRSRAIVRVPWDDMLPVATSGPSTLRPQTRVAYTALAGVLVAGLAAAPAKAAAPMRRAQ